LVVGKYARSYEGGHWKQGENNSLQKHVWKLGNSIPYLSICLGGGLHTSFGFWGFGNPPNSVGGGVGGKINGACVKNKQGGHARKSKQMVKRRSTLLRPRYTEHKPSSSGRRLNGGGQKLLKGRRKVKKREKVVPRCCCHPAPNTPPTRK